jgi:hypothetical protein
VKSFIIPAPNIWSDTEDVVVYPGGVFTVGIEENYFSVLRTNNENTKVLGQGK